MRLRGAELQTTTKENEELRAADIKASDAGLKAAGDSTVALLRMCVTELCSSEGLRARTEQKGSRFYPGVEQELNVLIATAAKLSRTARAFHFAPTAEQLASSLTSESSLVEKDKKLGGSICNGQSHSGDSQARAVQTRVLAV